MKRRAGAKRFDCLALKRRAQLRVYAETREMTAAQQVEYFRRRAEAGELGAWWRRVTGKDTEKDEG